MTTINARFRIRGVTTGGGAPADHMWREIAVNESNNTFWYGYGVGTGDQAAASHLLFRSDGTRLWHDIVGASDGSTVFVGDGSALTGVTVGSIAWSAITSTPTTLAGYGITDAVGSGDSRLTDAREWTASTVSQAEAEAGTATTRRAWTAQRVFQAIAAWWAASAAKSKLDGIATGATANSPDATLLARANHTGTQAASTITGLATVATSGAYSDLSGLPSLFDGTWSSLTGKPSTFAPSAHTHAAADISDSTSAGRAVLTAADASAQRSALGLGTLATQSGTFSGTSSGTNTGDQTITLTGDVTGTGTGSFAATLSATGVTAGTYRSVTVDAKGRVTGGTNPTTLAGYGITDAAPSSHVGAGGAAHAAATTSVAGFMAAADKTKLDGIEAGAQVNTVASVAGKTGSVTLGPSDVGAAAASHTHPASEISDSTAAGRAVLTAADAAAQRTALGLGSAAVAAILGTVSQSGGAPNGDIFESGSDANGYYFRLANGLQVSFVTGLDWGNSAAVGAGTLADPYRTAVGSWTFPSGKTFAAAPVVVGMVRGDAASVHRNHALTIRYVTTSGVSQAHAVRLAQVSTALTPAIDLVAVGRWF